MSDEKKLYRRMDTPEAREFWRHCEDAAARVAKWPLWKRGEGESEFAKQRAVTDEKFQQWEQRTIRMLENNWGLCANTAECRRFFDHLKQRLKASHEQQPRKQSGE